MFPPRPTPSEEEQTAQRVLLELARGQPKAKAFPEAIVCDIRLSDMAKYRAMQQLQLAATFESLQTSQMFALGAPHFHPAPQGLPYSDLSFGAPPAAGLQFGEVQMCSPLLRQNVGASSFWPHHQLFPSSTPAMMDTRGLTQPFVSSQCIAASHAAASQLALPPQQSFQHQQFARIPQEKALPLSPNSLKKTAALPRNVGVEANPAETHTEAEGKPQSHSRQSSTSTNEPHLSLRMAGLPAPDSDSWMYKIDEVHPSPAIEETQDGSASMIQQVKPDTKTKKCPVLEGEITRYDILCGRGGRTNHHEGNMKFRRLVSKYKKAYVCAQKFEKRQLVAKVVDFVRRGRGRFLQQCKIDGIWYETGDDKAYSKMAQLLREGASAASLYRELISNAQGSNQSFNQELPNNTGTGLKEPVMKEAALEDLTNTPRLVSFKSQSNSSDQHIGRAFSARSLPFRKRNLAP